MMKPIYAVLLATAGTLAGCSDEIEVPVEAEVGLEARNARLVLPPVAGNPAAVYFDLVNTTGRGIAVRKAVVEGAGSAQLHGSMEWSGEMTMGESGPQTVKAGQTLSFEPGGLHVMAFDLEPEIKAGGTVEITLTVAGGDTTSFPAEIRAAGDER